MPTVDSYLINVSLGNVPGHSIVRALGERELIKLTTTGEDIWRGNELSPSPTSHTKIPTPSSTGEKMTIVSESNDDTILGSGVQKVRIDYLDGNGDPQTIDKDMAGTTPVDITEDDMSFINDFFAIQVGAGGVADDHIKIYQTADDGLVYNMIGQGGNKSLVPLRKVPRGHTLILRGWGATEAKAKRCAYRIRSTDMNGILIPGVFCFKGTTYLNQSASSDLELLARIPELSIVKVSGWADQNDAEGSVHWWGILINSKY